MKPVQPIKNHYVGINAHLHSHWQADGEWHEFHTAYIVYLIRTLKQQLHPMGYTARIESSLQIHRFDQPDSRPRADINIYDLDPIRAARPPIQSSADATNSDIYAVVLDLPELLESEEEPIESWAIAIYEARSTTERGDPIAWIEILLPANKLEGKQASDYRKKRNKLLDSALVFVEIDLLHESPSTFRRILTYYDPDRHSVFDLDAHPYHIVVIDPRPMISQGKAHLHHFDVEMPIPQITIPLSGDDTVTVDLQAPYNRTLEETLFTSEFVDYMQLPQHFDRYSPADQQRIAARMVAVLTAAQQGNDLEAGPFPLPDLPLAEALQQIAQLTNQ